LGLTGELINVEQALRIGLIHEISTADKIEDQIKKKVNQLLLAGPKAISVFKAFCKNLNPDKSAKMIAELRASDEGQEGLAAFLEKRKPNWVETLD
jgi:methylglutaconyl-CoA hydratase